MFPRVCHFAFLMGLSALSSAASPAGETSARQVNRGREIALQICAACHVVAPAQQFAPLLNPPAPPFAEIANRADSTRASLRQFVAHTHWDEKSLPLTMPNPSLTESQITEVVTYILSLRTQ